MTNNFKNYVNRLLVFIRGELFLKILSGFLAAFLLYALIMLIISPGIARLSFAGADQLKPLTAEEIGMLDDDTAFELLQGKAFLTSRMTRTKDDSIGLAIDLKAMTIALEIKGVVLFSRPIEDADISPYFNGLHDSLLLKITSVPLTATSFRSTIVKEPIIEKIAPKDTSEVQLDAYNVDTSYREPAFLIITLDNGMELILKQYHGVSFKDRIKYGSFIFRERANRISSTLKALLRGRTPEYIPYATIELQAKDIRIIYRALPQHPRISLRLI